MNLVGMDSTPSLIFPDKNGDAVERVSTEFMMPMRVRILEI